MVRGLVSLFIFGASHFTVVRIHLATNREPQIPDFSLEPWSTLDAPLTFDLYLLQAISRQPN